MPRFSKMCLVAAVVCSAGCTTEDTVRMDGLTTGAGDAIAGNTVMQMVDPWPRGVEDTELLVPADLGRYQSPEAAAVAAERVDSSVAGDK